MDKITSTFNYKREEAQNPYTGFMSFQHFRGEKLYSDIEVRPENNRTETERVECYPPSPDAMENGREEGYYPDTTIVYIRILWKEFEPERGVYNYDFVDRILDEAKAHNQTLIFRLMAHNTRACDDVPEWLKSMIPCPERPDGMRVKDSPTDPLFIDLFLEAVRALGERYDSDPYFDAIDISLPGAWGEGYKLELYPPDTFDKIVSTYVNVFRKTRLLGQAAKPNLVLYETGAEPIGWRGDGFGEPSHLEVTYPKHIPKIADVWKVAPVSFESFWWLCEWKRQGWDIDRIIERSLEWHISSFNAKSMPVPYEWRDKVDAWIDRMGYHFSPESLTYKSTVKRGTSLDLTLVMNNIGVAPIYKKLPLLLRLSSGENTRIFDTGVDIRRWMPGNTTENISIGIPFDIPSGEYSLSIAITGECVPMIYFATDAVRDGAFYKLGAITVE